MSEFPCEVNVQGVLVRYSATSRLDAGDYDIVNTEVAE